MKQRKFTKKSLKTKKIEIKIKDKLHIWIDGYEANVPQRLGSSQVAYELIKNLEALDKKNRYTIILPSKPISDLPLERPGWNYKILKPNKLWTRLSVPFALFLTKDKPDLIYSPTHYIPRFTKIKRISTIFDLSYLHFPKMFLKKDLWKLTNWTKYSILNSSKIITISKFSKKDILENYKIDRKKVVVAYPGYDDTQFLKINNKERIEQIKTKYIQNGNYVIFIGTLQPRKNLIRLIEGFSKVISDQNSTIFSDLKLVIVGKSDGLGRKGWMYREILDAPKKYNIEDRVIFTGFVSTDELPYLISGASVYIQPSLWEGFGIPVLESMACGVPIIVSNVSSLPEVVGDAGVLIDPYSTDQIAQSIRTLVTDKKLATQKAKLGLELVKKYSWKKMAKDLIKVFEEELYKYNES